MTTLKEVMNDMIEEKSKIMVVDDDHEIREVISVLLSNEDFDIIEAESGEEALKLLAANIDLIILDVMMPGMSGYQVSRMIRERSNVPILFLTARTQNSDLVLGYSSGGDDYLAKPFSYPELIARVKPHVHVDNNSKNIHGVENVDGTPSHGKTLDGSKVPKDVQKKVKDSKDYKKGQKDLKKMQEAKREIHRRKLNLSVNKDLLIAAGIFVTAVGVAFVAPEFLPALLAAV